MREWNTGLFQRQLQIWLSVANSMYQTHHLLCQWRRVDIRIPRLCNRGEAVEGKRGVVAFRACVTATVMPSPDVYRVKVGSSCSLSFL